MESQTAAVKSRPIFVLGVDRSGTSLLSEIAYKWGAYPGDLGLLAAGNEGNPQGYWEYEPMEELVNKLFTQAKVSHWDPAFGERLREQASDPDLRRETLALIASMEKGPAWFWKEPYLSISMPFWEQVLTDPIFVIPVRNPYESAMSYEKFMLPPNLRGGVRLLSLFFLRWQYFMLCILEASEKSRSVIYIPYDKLLRSPVEQCERLCGFLDAECGISEPDRDKVRRMIECVKPELYRNRATDFTEVPQATPEQKALYDFLLRKVDDPAEPYDPSLYPMNGWWREYMENFDLLLGLLNIV